jgi:hypothetical protein
MSRVRPTELHRRIGRSEVHGAPAAASPPVVMDAAAPSTHAASKSLALVGPYPHHQVVTLETHALDHDLLDTQQPLEYTACAHVAPMARFPDSPESQYPKLRGGVRTFLKAGLHPHMCHKRSLRKTRCCASSLKPGSSRAAICIRNSIATVLLLDGVDECPHLARRSQVIDPLL